MKTARCNICKRELGGTWASSATFGGICGKCWHGAKDEIIEERFYKRGQAIGRARIETDDFVFNFRTESFEIPTANTRRIVKYNPRWHFYTAKVADLRKIQHG